MYIKQGCTTYLFKNFQFKPRTKATDRNKKIYYTKYIKFHENMLKVFEYFTGFFSSDYNTYS